jgi:hypothetical protein
MGRIWVFLCVGDNFAILAKEGNNEGDEFYVLQCQKTTHIVRNHFICPWGDEFDVGNNVIDGIYYQKWGHGENNGYIFLTNS